MSKFVVLAGLFIFAALATMIPQAAAAGMSLSEICASTMALEAEILSGAMSGELLSEKDFEERYKQILRDLSAYLAQPRERPDGLMQVHATMHAIRQVEELWSTVRPFAHAG